MDRSNGPSSVRPARAGAGRRSGSGRLGRTSCGDDAWPRSRTALRGRMGRGTMAADDRPGRALRPDRRGLRPLVGARPGTGGRRAARRRRAAHSAAPRHLLDIGTGTGQLGLGAVERWPDVSVVGIDASAEMARWPTRRRTGDSPTGQRARFRSVVAFADRLPFGGRRVRRRDVVVRPPARPEPAPRAARDPPRPAPGRRCSPTSRGWTASGSAIFRADAVFDEVLDDFGIDRGRAATIGQRRHPVGRARGGELRRAGFARRHGPGGRLAHRFTVDGYIGFLTEFDEETLFAELEPDLRDRRARHAPRAPDGAQPGADDDARPDRVRDRPPVALTGAGHPAPVGQPSSDSAAPPSPVEPPRRPRPRQLRPRRPRPHRRRPALPRRAAPGPWR